MEEQRFTLKAPSADLGQLPGPRQHMRAPQGHHFTCLEIIAKESSCIMCNPVFNFGTNFEMPQCENITTTQFLLYFG